MSRIWEIAGGLQWYSDTTDRNTKLAYGPLTLLGDNFTWVAPTLRWEGLTIHFATNTDGGTAAKYNTIADNSTTGVTLNDGEALYVDVNRATNAASLTPAIAASYLALGTPVMPGSRYILAWRLGSNVYTRDRAYEVGRNYTIASTTVSGVVRTSTTSTTPTTPYAVMSIGLGGIAVASGLSRIGISAGTLAIGGDANDTLISMTASNGITATATAGNHYGLYGTGAGVNEGVFGVGGASGGGGVRGEGYNGGSGGNGVTGIGRFSGTGGVFIGGATDADGVSGQGNGTGATPGRGGYFQGGSGSGSAPGHGLTAKAGNAGGWGTPVFTVPVNGIGALGVGSYAGPGVVGVGGATNNTPGVLGIGCATGPGVRGYGSTTGYGVHGLLTATASSQTIAVMGDASASVASQCIGVQGIGGGVGGMGGYFEGSGYSTGGPGIIGSGRYTNPSIVAWPLGTGADIRLTGLSSDPTTGLTDGDIWYNTVDKSIRARLNAATIVLGVGGNSLPTITWNTVTLNGADWTLVSGKTLSYYKDAHGIVHMKGEIQSTGTTATVGTLNSGYRPLAGITSVFVVGITTGPYSAACIGIASGVISISNGTPSAGARYSFDGVCFPAEG
jgi:hypothetical protein